MVKKGKFNNCPINLIGGIFKNKNAETFINDLLKSAHLDGWKKIYNRAYENPTVVVVKKIIPNN